VIVLASERYTHVINVSALEGKFSVGKKSAAHPHTNMGKAALNMMTLTCARDFLKSKILVNAVDTGWVTDMAPLGQGAKAKTHATHVGPPLDEEVREVHTSCCTTHRWHQLLHHSPLAPAAAPQLLHHS
jgi:NAD(P)-dependent dehydrogenase (short-subunit alcohol dehydrogenase family)